MFRIFTKQAAAVAVSATLMASAQTATLTHRFANVGVNTWEASFGVTAGPGQTVQAFSIFLDWTKASNLAVQASPANWDTIVIQPDIALASDGYYDTLSLGSGIGSGLSMVGFSITFQWAGGSLPSMLPFTINDPITFLPSEFGVTTNKGHAVGVTTVPEPSSWALIGLALAMSVLCRRKTASK